MDDDIIASFMEITSCGSETTAVRHLASCNWRIEAAIELYFTAGDDADVHDPIPARSDTMHNEEFAPDAGDQVRAPIPARSDTLYNGSYAARSSTASSIWAAEREESPSGTSGPAVHVQVPSMPEISAIQLVEHDDDNEEYYSGKENRDEQNYYSAEENDEDFLMQPEDSDSDYNEYNDMEAELDGQPPSRIRAQTLNDLFQPPYELMFGGSFHEAKVHAAKQDRWLLINLQARGVFASHMHNRDLWSNEVVAEVIKNNFIFSLLEKTAEHGDEGSKVSCFYKLVDDQLPAVLVLDPITGQCLSKWSGSLNADDFLSNIGKYTEKKPSSLYKRKIMSRATPETPESNQSAPDAQEPVAPVATSCNSQEPAAQVATSCNSEEPAAAVTTSKHADKIESETVATVDYGEPTEGEKICRVRVRFPSGDVVTREFGSTRPVATLFAYCGSVVQGQAGKEKQAFRITRMVGRAYEELTALDASFQDLGLNCSTVSVVEY